MRDNLKQARKAAGMTQQAMADRLGISLRYYQQIEAGDRTGDFEMGIVKKFGPTLVKAHILWDTHFAGPIFRSYLCL